MSIFTTDLERARRAVSPRYAPPPTPLIAMLIHGGVTLLWVLLFLRAFGAGGAFAWSVGLAYIGYDTALLLFVFWQTLPLLRAATPGRQGCRSRIASASASSSRPTTRPRCCRRPWPPCSPRPIRPMRWSSPMTDRMTARPNCSAATGSCSPRRVRSARPGPLYPSLRWLRLRRGGKARALNEALGCIGSEVVLTVDADTVPDPEAIAAMRRAFAAEPDLVAATGVLFPVCPASPGGRVFQWFQTYEYMRNFLSRYAWARQDGLLLISGAFAALPPPRGAGGRRLRRRLSGGRLRTDAPLAAPCRGPGGAMDHGRHRLRPRPGPMRRTRSALSFGSAGAGSAASCKPNSGTGT